MKKIIKNKTFLIVILCIISCGIGVYAATTYKASDVVYNASDGSSMNVNDALNDLYSKFNKNDEELILNVESITYSKPFIFTGFKKGDLIRAYQHNHQWDRIIGLYVSGIKGAKVISQKINDTAGLSNVELYLEATSDTVEFTIGCNSSYETLWDKLSLTTVKHK